MSAALLKLDGWSVRNIDVSNVEKLGGQHSSLTAYSGNRIPAASAAGAATAYSFNGHPAALPWTMLADSGSAIFAAGGGEAAIGAQQGRNHRLVDADDTEEDIPEYSVHDYAGVDGCSWLIAVCSLLIPLDTAAIIAGWPGRVASVKIKNRCSCWSGGTNA